jgi:hypothetical protein
VSRPSRVLDVQPAATPHERTAEAEQGLEDRHRRAAAVVAKDELVEETCRCSREQTDAGNARVVAAVRGQ